MNQQIASPTPAPKMTAAQANGFFRQAVVNRAIKITQPLLSQSAAITTQSVFNFIPRNVGLLLGFYVLVSVNMLNASGTSNITNYGTANLLSNVTFTDFNNYQRVNAPGWYVHLINTIKDRRPFGIANTLTSSTVAYGSNITVAKAPATLSTSGQLVQHAYYIPVAYSEWDLRGAIYAAVTGGQMNLQLTVNTTPWVASGDAMNAIYSGGTGGAYSGSVTLDVYQQYYDQLPTAQQQDGTKVIVPKLDLSTTYEIKQTFINNLSVNQDNYIAFSNYREFLSTVAVFDNGGTFNSGSDVAYWGLNAANTLFIQKKEPWVIALDMRRNFGVDLPPATYYFGTRDKPINTQEYGNMNLVINPSTVNANAQVLVGYETLAQQNVVLGAQSFANG